MHAIVIRRHGDPDVLEAAEIPVPEPAEGEALVRVEAVSVNAFLDVSNRRGRCRSRATTSRTCSAPNTRARS
jgi:NADPH:quinone reductase-like Zn-dependent oxidoreductase